MNKICLLINSKTTDNPIVKQLIVNNEQLDIPKCKINIDQTITLIKTELTTNSLSSSGLALLKEMHMTHRRLFWDIVEKIEQLIDSGEYALASRLPPERVLAERFGVSRPTIREAIIALEVRGRVIVKTSSGVYVTNGHSKDYGNCDISAFELTQARALVEGEAAALAASSISSKELDNLEQALTRMALGDNAEEADKEFHRIISKATRNGAILAMVEKFWL